ncbi:MAG: type I-E CRISPR-associated protein Cas7/Cse4/CasC [Neomegalonema sp.]|nr:type I-E CRISPR-associated protein Cas7/Cse4/CasC [Neomegalonema sp.]
MTRFIQLHALTAYPPSNPNRDDLGRPKSAIYGDAPRLRISSQALKRAIRTYPSFQEKLSGQLSKRTLRFGEAIEGHLIKGGTDKETALKIAREVGGAFAKMKPEKDKTARTEQLAFISPDERRLALELADRAAAGEPLPSEADLKKTLLLKADGAADIAMFGRMLASAPDFNREAAVQVSHALTTHRAAIEDDFYTAVDDLKRPEEDMGAGFVGEAGFGSGVFYVYCCIDRDLLVENLGGDRDLASRAIEAFVEALALASPSGKKNSFANHVRAEFLLVELGDRQPRSLATAFLKPVRPRGADDDLMSASIRALADTREAFRLGYGQDWTSEAVLNIHAKSDGSGVFAADVKTLTDLAGFAANGGAA